MTTPFSLTAMIPTDGQPVGISLRNPHLTVPRLTVACSNALFLSLKSLSDCPVLLTRIGASFFDRCRPRTYGRGGVCPPLGNAVPPAMYSFPFALSQVLRNPFPRKILVCFWNFLSGRRTN